MIQAFWKVCVRAAQRIKAVVIDAEIETLVYYYSQMAA